MSTVSKKNQPRKYRPLFYAIWLLNIAISVHDGALVFQNRHIIQEYEQNPIGRWLLGMNSGGTGPMLLSKAIGTLIVATIVLLLYWRSPKVAWIICVTLAALQVTLLAYLHFR